MSGELDFESGEIYTVGQLKKWLAEIDDNTVLTNTIIAKYIPKAYKASPWKSLNQEEYDDFLADEIGKLKSIKQGGEPAEIEKQEKRVAEIEEIIPEPTVELSQ